MVSGLWGRNQEVGSPYRCPVTVEMAGRLMRFNALRPPHKILLHIFSQHCIMLCVVILFDMGKTNINALNSIFEMSEFRVAG
jgi:hypothetical protein